MKKNYDPNRLTKKQRHMKKWIPDLVYCHSSDIGKHKKDCPFWHSIDKKHKRSECRWAEGCTDDCEQCDEEIVKCDFLNYIEYGQYPLADMCKVCDIHMGDDALWKKWMGE